MVIKMMISSALHISVQTRYHMPYGNILSEFFFLIFPVCRWRQMFPCQRLGNCGMTEKMWPGGCLGLHLWRLFVCWFQLCFVWRAFGNQIMLLISKLPIGRTDEGKSSQAVWELFFPFLVVVMCMFLSSECVHCADFFLKCANCLIKLSWWLTWKNVRINMCFWEDEQVLKDKPEMSKWTLRYEAFGQEFKFSWLSRNLKVFSATA